MNRLLCQKVHRKARPRPCSPLSILGPWILSRTHQETVKEIGREQRLEALVRDPAKLNSYSLQGIEQVPACMTAAADSLFESAIPCLGIRDGEVCG